jgi:hypothetical protein
MYIKIKKKFYTQELKKTKITENYRQWSFKLKKCMPK